MDATADLAPRGIHPANPAFDSAHIALLLLALCLIVLAINAMVATSPARERPERGWMEAPGVRRIAVVFAVAALAVAAYLIWNCVGEMVVPGGADY